MKKEIEKESLMMIVGKSVIVKNDAVVMVVKAKEVINAENASYDIKQNARGGLLYVINGDALAIDNTYSDDEHLNELISSSSSKKISVFVYGTTEISLFPYKKEKIEILCDLF